MVEKWYSCAYCAELTKSTSSPNQGGCPEKRTHQWVTIGEVGPNKKKCRNCGIEVSVKMSAQQVGCTKGNSHTWYNV